MPRLHDLHAYMFTPVVLIIILVYNKMKESQYILPLSNDWDYGEEGATYEHSESDTYRDNY